MTGAWITAATLAAELDRLGALHFPIPVALPPDGRAEALQQLGQAVDALERRGRRLTVETVDGEALAEHVPEEYAPLEFSVVVYEGERPAGFPTGAGR